MALNKKEKIQLLSEYEELLKNSENLVVFGYDAIPVSESCSMRKQFKNQGALYKVVKKNVFARAIQNVQYDIDLTKLPNSISVLFFYGDGIDSLKIVESFKKQWKKNKVSSKLEYLGGWFAGEWQDSDYVSALAKLPSKQELVGKFLYMIKYPIQGFVTANSNLIGNFAKVLDQIAKKK